jgi:hypothetical protein
VLRIRDIFLVRIRIRGSVPLTNGSALRNEEVRKKADLETQMPVLTPENITARQESSHALCMKRGGADRSRQARAGQAHRRRVSFLVVRPGQASSTIPPAGDQRGTAGNSARAGWRAQRTLQKKPTGRLFCTTEATAKAVRSIVEKGRKSWETARWNGQSEGRASYLSPGGSLPLPSPRESVREEISGLPTGMMLRGANS